MSEEALTTRLRPWSWHTWHRRRARRGRGRVPGPCVPHTDATGDGQVLIVPPDGAVTEGMAHKLAAGDAVFEFHIVEDNQEFLAAVASDHVSGPDGRGQTGGLTEDFVAGDVAEGVVDVLEMVEVDEGDADRVTGLASNSSCDFERLKDGRAVGNSVRASWVARWRKRASLSRMV